VGAVTRDRLIIATAMFAAALTLATLLSRCGS